MLAQRYVDQPPRSPVARDRDSQSSTYSHRRAPVRSFTQASDSNASTYSPSVDERYDAADLAMPRSPYMHQQANYSAPNFAVGQQPYAADSLSPDDLQLDRMRIHGEDGSGAPWLPHNGYQGPLEEVSRKSSSSASSAERAAWRNSRGGSVEDDGASIADPYGGMAGDEGEDPYSRTPLASTSHMRTESGGTLPAGYYAPGPSSQEGHYSQEQHYYQQQPQYAVQQPGYEHYGYAQHSPQQQWQGQFYGGPPGMGYAPGPEVYQNMQQPYGQLQRNTSVSSNLTTGSVGLSRHGSTMPGGGGRGKAKLNPTGKERTITKSAIDEYRNRIKADPDPESQFNFAKFLVEAARKLAQHAQQTTEQSKARDMKKYRDVLLQEAIKLIKRLATQPQGSGKPAYADAQFFLADCLSSGSLGLQVDHEKAYNLYVQASKQNHAPATYRTAVCNEGGHGTKKDPQRAVLFYRKASALGNTPGMYKLGMILLNGLLGQPRNGKEAVVWLRRAAQQADEDNPHALHELGQLYERPPNPNATNGPGQTVPEDPAQAFELYQQAARLGYGLSQYKLGMAYEYGSLGCHVDPKRSVAHYSKAAERGVADAELALSGWYLTGAEGVLPQSDQEAYLWARRAANRGLPRGELRVLFFIQLGFMLKIYSAVGYYEEAGIGCKRDPDEAKRWYMRAAAQGNKRAMARLQEIKAQANSRGAGKRPTRKDAREDCVIS